MEYGTWGEPDLPESGAPSEDEEYIIEYYPFSLMDLIKMGIITLALLLLMPILSGAQALPVSYPRKLPPKVEEAVEEIPQDNTPNEEPETAEEWLSPGGTYLGGADEDPLDWWDSHPVFSLFPKYIGAGGVSARFREGPEDLTATSGYYQFKILNVEHPDYLLYLNMCMDEGLIPHDPFKGFVARSEIEAVARGGYVVFLTGGWRLNLYFRGYASELIFQIERPARLADYSPSSSE